MTGGGYFPVVSAVASAALILSAVGAPASAAAVPAVGGEAPAALADRPGPGGAGARGAGPKVRWDWTMPSFMKDTKKFVPTDNPSAPGYWQGGTYVRGSDGIPDRPMAVPGNYRAAGNSLYGKLPADGRFRVRLDGRDSSGKGELRCDWTITTGKAAGGKTYRRSNRACGKVTPVRLPEGKHRLTLKVTDGTGRSNSRSGRITVKNVLVAIMGDSYASGEGLPPFLEKSPDGTTRQIDWDYGSCNRTRWSGFVRGAQAIESADKRSNVTLVDVACAGAEVDKGHITNLVSTFPPKAEEKETGGILYPQRRLIYNGTQLPGYQPPQVDQVRTITRGAVLDVMFLSIGGNDAGLSDIGIACAVEDAVGANCYSRVPFFWDQEPNAKPLYQIADDNLAALRQRYDRMAPCLGAKGKCRTTKVTGSTIASSPSKSAPLQLRKSKSVLQAMYPDLTTGPPLSDPQPCRYTFPPETVMNQIDNSWALDALYEGQPGVTFSLPTRYSPPLKPPVPASLTPTAAGLVGQLQRNGDKFGWTIGTTMYDQSHGHGLCAGADAWLFGLTQALEAKNPANSAAALHPNNSGQQQYADMLGARGMKLAGVPVSRG